MQDVKIDNLELFYDYMDESNNLLYEIYHKPYFELIEMSAANLLAGEILNDVDEDSRKKLNKIYKKIAKVDFSVEDVRKAMQSIILRGFKEMNIPNGSTTPDTIGIFIAYLITKLCPSKNISICDPLCGTGNMLLTIANHLDKNVSLSACDQDIWMTKLIKIQADLISTNVDIYFQNALSLYLKDIDVVTFDMPHSINTDKGYFPYQAILHFADYVKENGSMIGVVENDFFDYDKNQEFKKELLSKMTIIGIVELPDNMFKNTKPKIILVLRKKIEDKKCFMVKLPSFEDVKKFNESLIEIEAWFEKNK